jgi:hypothetical protein
MLLSKSTRSILARNHGSDKLHISNNVNVTKEVFLLSLHPTFLNQCASCLLLVATILLMQLCMREIVIFLLSFVANSITFFYYVTSVYCWRLNYTILFFTFLEEISEITHMAIGIESELRFLYSTLVIMHVFSLLNNICNNPIR